MQGRFSRVGWKPDETNSGLVTMSQAPIPRIGLTTERSICSVSGLATSSCSQRSTVRSSNRRTDLVPQCGQTPSRQTAVRASPADLMIPTLWQVVHRYVMRSNSKGVVWESILIPLSKCDSPPDNPLAYAKPELLAFWSDGHFLAILTPFSDARRLGELSNRAVHGA